MDVLNFFCYEYRGSVFILNLCKDHDKIYRYLQIFWKTNKNKLYNFNKRFNIAQLCQYSCLSVQRKKHAVTFTTFLLHKIYYRAQESFNFIWQFTVPTCQSFRNVWPIRSLLMVSSLQWSQIIPHINTCCICKNLLSLKNFRESKCSWYLNFLWIYFRTHYMDIIWCTIERWAIDRRMGITPRLPCHYLILFIPSLTRKLHF